jgi:DNA polymerase III alpha subunit
MLLGVALHDHPIQRYRDTLLAEGILGSREVLRCPSRKLVKVCGMIVVHQAPPTAKGFHFVTLEDEEGFLNIVVRPDVFMRYRKVLRDSSFLIVDGYVERQGIVTNVIAREIRPLARMA